MEQSNEVIVKNEPICDCQSISQTKEVLATKVKEEPKDIQTMQTSEETEVKEKGVKMKVKEEREDNEMQTSQDIEEKAEEKFSSREFSNKISIAFLNWETTTKTSDDNPTLIINQPTTSNNEPNNPKNNKSK